MAEGKKSFVLYSDQRGVFDKLSDEQAGKLIKHIYSYVNDENPVADFITDLAFELIKTQLKRDLKKWESARVGKSDAGRLGNLKRWNQDLYELVSEDKISIEQAEKIAKDRKESQTVANIAVNVNDNANVTVNETAIKDKEVVPPFNFKKSLIDLGVQEPHLSDWLKVRKAKKATNTQTALDGFLKECEKANKTVDECVKICAQNSWAGFKQEWLHQNNFNNGKSTKEKQRDFIDLLSQTDAWKDA